MTLHNWKTILENWINCYFERPSNSKQKVEAQSLLNIISYLRENLCLDDSKSSLVEAQTLEEFVQEKFPGVVFQNGGGEVTETELYIVASLLLFFVCVNSKDIDIKNAMCNKLSVNDQETIMKFTKVLMETAVITCKDVQNAITEACNDPAASERCTTVAETPPAIRNMHCEVRRLQAALEAERFDKNFLQEELSRTNYKLEILTQDKDQYKVDILALKARISNCCGQESDRQTSNEAEHNASVKLLRQLEEMEERLVDTRTQLDEAVHERNIYKAKVEELKLERNKWINTSQEESLRVAVLSQQLEVEHHNNELLKELVADLRRHNDHNVVDTSQLECDDPDVSLQSIGRNMSVCNEVCANVVEVQLSEERAKILVLQQQINLLQVHLTQLEQTAIEQKSSLEHMLLSKDKEIEHLNIEVQKEMQNYNSLQMSSNEEIMKLKHLVEKLNQKMMDNKEQTNNELNKKEKERAALVKEINIFNEQVKQLEQTAREQKSSLHHVILSKDKEIEHLNLDIQKEMKKYNSLQMSSNDEIIKFNNVIDEMNQKIKDNEEKANKELDNKEKEQMALVEDISNLNKKIKQLEQTVNEQKTSLEHLLLSKDKEIENLNIKIQKEMQNYNSLQMSSNEEVLKLKHLVEELNQKMKDNKEQANNEFKKKEKELVALVDEINIFNEQFKQLEQTAREQKSSLEHMLLSKDKEIELLNLDMQKEMIKYNSLQMSSNDEIIKFNNVIDELNQKIKDNEEKANKELDNKEKERMALVEDISNLNEQFKQQERMCSEQKTSLEYMLLTKDKEIEHLNIEILKDMQNYNTLQMSSNEEIIKLKQLVKELNQKITDNKAQANSELNKKKKDLVSLMEDTNKLNEQLKQLEQMFKEQKTSLEHMILSIDKEIEHLNIEIQKYVQNYNSLQISSNEEIIKLKHLVKKLNQKIKDNEEQANRELDRKEHARLTLVDEANILHENLKQLEQTANEQKTSLEHLLLSKDKEIESLNLDMQTEINKYNCLQMSSNDEIIKLNKKLDELGQKIKDNEENSRTELNKKEQDRLIAVKETDILYEQLKKLEQTANEQKSSLENLLLSNGKEIEHLKIEVNEGKKQYNCMQISSSNEIDKLRTDVDELKLKMKNDEEETLRKLDNKEQDKLSLLETYTETSGKLQKQIDSIETENQRLISELKEVINTKSILTEQNNTLIEQLEQLGQTANKQRSSLEKLLLSKDQEIKHLKFEVNEGKEQYNYLQISSSDDINKLKTNVDQLKLKMKNDEEEAYRKLNNNEQDKLSLLQNFTETSDKLQKQIETIEAENKRFISELNEEIKSKLILAEQNNKLIEQLEQLGQTANEQKSSLENLLLSKDQEIKQLKFEVNEGNEQYNYLQISSSDDINKLKTNVDQLKLKMKNDEEEAYRKLNNNEQDKLSLLQNFTETSDKLQKQIETIEAENKRFISELNEEIKSKLILAEQNNKLIEQLEQLGQTANEQKSSLENLLLSKDQEIKQLKFEVNEGNEQYNCLQISSSDDINKLKTDVDELKLKMKNDEEEAYRKFDNNEREKLSLLQNFTETCDKLQKQIESTQTENQRLLCELKEEITSKLSVTEQNNILLEQLKQLEQTANGQKSSLEHLLLSKDKELERLKLEVYEGKEQYNYLQISSSEEIDKLKTDVDELKLKIKNNEEEAYRKLDNDEQDKLSLLQSFTETCDKLQKQIESTQTENQRLLSELKEEITSKLSITEQNNILLEQLKQLEQTAMEQKSSLENVLLSKGKELEHLKLEVNEGKEQYNCLQISSSEEIDKLKTDIDELKLKMKNDEEEACRKLSNKEQDKLLLLQKFTESTNGLQKKMESMEKENEKLIQELKEEISCKLTLMEETNVLHETLKHIQLNFVGEKTTMSELISKQDTDVRTIILKINEVIEDYNRLKTLSEEESNRLNNYINEVENKKRESDEMVLRQEQEITKLQEDLNSKAALKNSLDILQENFKQIEQSANEDKKSFSELISLKDKEIENLKQIIKDEVNKQISMEKSLSNDVSILNNRINELGQTIKENQKVANRDQEENMLLLDKINELKKEVKYMETENEELKTELSKNKNSEVIINENYEVTVKEWNAKVQILNAELDTWLHTSKENTTGDAKEKVNEYCCNKEPVVLAQHGDDKIVCGDSDQSNQRIKRNEVVEINQEPADFKQQIDSLEIKLKQYQQIANRDKVKLKELLSNKDAEIAKLKCQVRAEMEKYISLKESLNDEIRRLHSDISYYEVKLNECEQLAYKELNQKVKDISTLQEDKLTLLKSLTDRIDVLEEKLETIQCENDRLKNDLNKEQNSKMKMQDDYESHVTKLNEKISKMSVTENRASQIIKVSAKYQAIILKRVAEIKSNTVLKELTNFGNMPCDNEVRRSINAGSITMEELESFLETTDKHLRKCSEKQNALQKERDRLAAVVKINESEIINMKKYLTELAVYFKTFGSVKQVYNQKLSQVVSQQRTVRREILSLEERLSDGALAKLERGYTSVLQDLTECAMSFERWVERCISRTVSPEKISLGFTSEHASLAGGNFQNSSLESQLDDIDKGFQRLLLDISRAQRGEGSKDAQTMTIMEVKAEYEDKLERMKAKMKQIYQEQTTIFREKQREEVGSLERQLQHARDKLLESSRAYEEHIRGLTSELWNVGEKFLIEKNEADWLKRKCISGSLMSLQQVHSSGLVPPREVKPRPSDTYSLRSLPLHNKSEARTLHMSDEEGEVFDNRWLKELSATPRTGRSSQVGGEPRLSELRYRNSLCPPHLKSSYPAETQFAPTIDEEDIKCSGIGGRQRKEVGITAYKKPGPPTPSKQAGRLSATDSELREGLRSEPDTTAPRKTSTPSRIRALFRSSKTLTDNTASPRRRLSIFRNKK